MITLNSIFTPENILNQYFIATRGKRYHEKIIEFNKHALTNLIQLNESVLNGTYRPGPDRSFIIHEPKKRVITANTFEDKIVQGVLVKHALTPLIDPKLIYDNYASRKGKGTMMALDRLDDFLHAYYNNFHTNEGYILKCDIRKYFYRINVPIIMEKINRLQMNDKLKELFQIEVRPWDKVDTGLCIGHEISQWLAIYYLNDMDHMIKEKLRINYYGRFMDDFYLIHPSRSYLQDCLEEIDEHLATIKLELNEKTQLYNLKHGIKFLGFHTYLTDTGKVFRLINQENVRRMIRRMLKYKELVESGVKSIQEVLEGYTAWRAHAIQGDTEKLLYWLDSRFYEIFENNLRENDIDFSDYCYVPGRFVKGKRVKEKDIMWAKKKFVTN